MKHANSFMKTVMEKALQIEHYWGRVEFAPGRGAIHLHIVDSKEQNLLTGILQCIIAPPKSRSTQQLCNSSP